MKNIAAFLFIGCIVAGFVVLWVAISWLCAFVTTILLSTGGVLLFVKLRAPSNPTRVVTALLAILILILASTEGEFIGFGIALSAQIVIGMLIALVVLLGKSKPQFGGLWGALQAYGQIMAGLEAPRKTDNHYHKSGRIKTKTTPLSTPPPVPALSADPAAALEHMTVPVQMEHDIREPYLFIGEGNSISISGIELRSPLIYVTYDKNYSDFDASIVYMRRKISVPIAEPHGTLGYWPQTCELSSHQMGNYLAWHASGRQNPQVDIGYVFLYFYGLERRALLDRQNIQSIAVEVLRLLNIYGGQRSFLGYATGLLRHMIMSRLLEPSTELMEQLIRLHGNHVSDALLNMFLGHLALKQIALPSKWAIMLAKQDERSRRSIVLDRNPEEFENLFVHRYIEKFGSSLCPKLSGKNKNHAYRPASPSLISGYGYESQIPSAAWPSLAGWKRQFGPVVKLYNTCIEELKGYSQKVKTKGVDSLAAYEALPEDLREATEHPLQAKWDAIVEETSGEEDGVRMTPVSALAEMIDITYRPKLTLSQSKSIASLIDTFGTSIEPDVRYTQKGYRWGDKVALLRLPDEPSIPQGSNYALVSMLMPLAMEVSLASGAVEPEEETVIVEFFEERFMLSRNDRIRTGALMKVLLNSTLSLSGLKKSVTECFEENQREAIGKFLVIIAGASEGVCDAEVKALNKTFKALNVSPSLVQTYINDLGFGPPKEPVTVQERQKTEAGEAIPGPAPTVDVSKAIKIMEDTKEIVDILVQATDANQAIPTIEVDDQENPNQDLTEEQSQNEDTDVPFVGELREKLHPVLSEILTREQWSADECKALAGNHGITFMAAIDEINEWSCEYLGDFLLEGEDTIIVNHNIVK